VINIENNKVLQTLEGHQKDINTIKYLHEYNKYFIASGSDDQSIMIWDLKAGIKVRTLSGGCDNVLFIDNLNFKGPSYLISLSKDYKIKIWNLKLANNSCLKTLQGHNSPISKLIEIRKDFICSSDNSGVIISWKYSGEKSIKKVNAHNGNKITSLVKISKFSVLISICSENILKIWDIHKAESHSNEVKRSRNRSGQNNLAWREPNPC